MNLSHDVWVKLSCQHSMSVNADYLEGGWGWAVGEGSCFYGFSGVADLPLCDKRCQTSWTSPDWKQWGSSHILFHIITNFVVVLCVTPPLYTVLYRVICDVTVM